MGRRKGVRLVNLKGKHDYTELLATPQACKAVSLMLLLVVVVVVVVAVVMVCVCVCVLL